MSRKGLFPFFFVNSGVSFDENVHNQQKVIIGGYPKSTVTHRNQPPPHKFEIN